MTLDNNGRLIVCEHATSMVTARDHHGGELEVLASHFEGYELNSPNDVIVTRDGDVIFTDPTFGRTMESVGVLRELEQPLRGVYRLVGGVGPLELVVGDVVQPNGLCLSVDESILYVGDTAKGHIRAFELKGGRYVDYGAVFAEGISETSAADDGFVDGLKLDELGNVYVTGPGGVWVFSPAGERIGVIQIPEQAANLNWGGPDWKSLYVTANTSVYCLRMAVAGNRLGYMR
jgi:gluconolactonase